MSYLDDMASLLSATTAYNAGQAALDPIAAQKMADLVSAWTTRLASMQQDLYIDQVNGLDTNPGTQALPLKGFYAALQKTPPGGYLNAWLLNNFTLDQHIYIEGNRHLRILSGGGVRRTLYHGISVTAASSVAYTFMFLGRGQLTFDSLDHQIPSGTGYANPVNWGLIKATYPAQTGTANTVTYSNCAIRIPATAISSIIATDLNTWEFRIFGCTFPDQPIIGRLFTGTTNTSTGTAVSPVEWLRANIAYI